MRFKRSYIVFISIVSLALFVLACDKTPTIEGSHTRVPNQQFDFDGKTVEVIEFLSFYCGTCYDFERSIPVIRGNFPKMIRWRIVPVYWGEGSPKPGEAYFLAEEAGKGGQMKEAIFNAYFVERKDIGNIEVLEAVAEKVGLGSDFSRRLRAGDKAEEARKALDMARTYQLEETPTLIIAGDIMTNPHAFDHDTEAFADNVIIILKSILR